MIQALPRPSSPFAQLDGKRIAGNTLVVVVHVLAFATLMMPARWEPPVVRADPVVVVPEVRSELPPPPPPPPPPEEVVIRRVDPQPTTTPVRIEDVPPIESAEVFTEGDLPPLAEPDVGPPVQSFDPGPVRAELSLDVHPAPRYPRLALRNGLEGTVVLRVLVDAQGRPQEVSIERSSGHRELDRAARETVQERWRFHPAQRDGQAVSAWGLVPIRFTLP